MGVPILENIVRQHAESAAHLWNIYDFACLNPDDNPDMDAERLVRVVDRLNAHLDGLRVAGEDGRRIATERYEEYPEAGELFVLRMLQPNAAAVWVEDLDLPGVRAFLADALG